MEGLGADGREKAIAFLLAMIDEAERDHVVALIGARELTGGEHDAAELYAPASEGKT
jgi:hypothetical protein